MKTRLSSKQRLKLIKKYVTRDVVNTNCKDSALLRYIIEKEYKWMSDDELFRIGDINGIQFDSWKR